MLTRSKDRKVAAHISVLNSFGLPSGRNYSCPGQTSVCEKVCYAGRKIEKMYPSAMALLVRNWDALQGKNEIEMFRLLDAMISEFVADCERKGVEKKFRIHWDGDFFSYGYARAWEAVILNHPDVQFWAYTRSFIDEINVVPTLSALPNLSLYLSVDADNLESAKAVRKQYPTVRWAWLDATFEAGSVAMKANTGKPGAKCPENAKQIPLIENKRGACVVCDLCVSGKTDVRFSIKKG